MSDPIRQVLVVNLRANMSIGRLMAQIAHASVLSIVEAGKESGPGEFFIDFKNQEDFEYWLKESFTKAVVKTWGNDEMLALYADAKAAGLPASKMEEEGWITALAIGPAKASLLQPITGHLPLM